MNDRYVFLPCLVMLGGELMAATVAGRLDALAAADAGEAFRALSVLGHGLVDKTRLVEVLLVPSSLLLMIGQLLVL